MGGCQRRVLRGPAWCLGRRAVGGADVSGGRFRRGGGEWETYVHGLFGTARRGGAGSDSGERLLEMCAGRRLGVSDAFFRRRDSHAYAWYKWGDRGVRSRIGCIMARGREVGNVVDAGVVPSESVGAGRGMVVATVRGEARGGGMGRTFRRRSVDVGKLVGPGVDRRCREEVSCRLARLSSKLNSAEEEWMDFEDIIRRTAERVVGRGSLEGDRKGPRCGGTGRQDGLRGGESDYSRGG